MTYRGVRTVKLTKSSSIDLQILDTYGYTMYPARSEFPTLNRKTWRGATVPAGATQAHPYARSDLFERRRRLMDDWAAYLDRGRR